MKSDSIQPTPVHVVVSTHTTRHLARVIQGLVVQTRTPTSVVVTSDVDEPAIHSLVEEMAPKVPFAMMLVQRSHTGKSRSSQVRNNGVRALIGRGQTGTATLLFLDGDCVPGTGSLESHAELCAPQRLVVGFRHDLTEEQTDCLVQGLQVSVEESIKLLPSQILALVTREKRYRRQAFLKRFGLAKPHKPKLLSANFSVSLVDYAAINGFDERYEGYGQEDDDLGRRLYQQGCTPVTALARTIVYHQFHPTRAPGAWHESLNAELFQRSGPAFCHLGLNNPAAQPALSIWTWPSARTPSRTG